MKVSPHAGPLYKWFKEHRRIWFLSSFFIVAIFVIFIGLFPQEIVNKVYGIGLLSIVGIPLLVFIVEQMKYNVAYVGRYSSPLAGCVPRNKHPTFWIIWIFVQFMSLLFILGFSVYLIIK
ncbi:hypothetical protein HOL21_02480 [Candidatus Woesearchaeota archaeon]|jgi:hypothetical protein|nr:hypothetical protein [Candidatus Woesearchaeota archaeon]MBT5397058.1 hypothetical protein [Candidatus Woesearchaeota archaeon]MBT6367396.1 hypothetical protein [Candidatus Woesearchaeota archaeon]MBT7762458.1 hypothetical protein [Candidatus Woesearchaeota archaeon]